MTGGTPQRFYKDIYTTKSDIFKYLKIQVNINKYKVIILIDSKVIGNYISTSFFKKYNIPTVKKKQPYTLTVINGSKLGNNRGKVNKKTILQPIIIGKYYKKVIFDVIKLAI